MLEAVDVSPAQRERAIVGCLWGTAVGDALGLPCEGLTPRRQQRLFPIWHNTISCSGTAWFPMTPNIRG